MYRLLIGLLGIILMASSSTYVDSIREWQQQRDKSLRSPDGWLTLVGLFWLKPGDNTIGSADSNDFVLPKGAAPEHVGTLHLEGERVTFTAAHGASRVLSHDEEKPDVVQAGKVSFYVIKRGDRLGIRAKDPNSPARRNFRGMKYFPVNPEYHFDA